MPISIKILPQGKQQGLRVFPNKNECGCPRFQVWISVGNAGLKNQSGCPHSIACKVVELDLLNANFFHEKYGQPKKIKKVSLCCKRFDILFDIIDLSQKKRKNNEPNGHLSAQNVRLGKVF